MAKVKFSVACLATYQSELEIPDEIKDNKEEVLKFVQNNLSNANILDLTWMSDLEDPSEAVMMEDIQSIEEEADLDLD